MSEPSLAELEAERDRLYAQLAAGEVARVRVEVARHGEFAAISEQIAEVNEKICEARAVAAADAPSGTEVQKGGPGQPSRQRRLPS